ncbi:unnamed protein product [Oikopleura dioica]|uniref:Uncharacterized protein n=1 Tax=Oikopleura dioica TaxID=34765 RepID=E4WUQ3_OIKDI|nr:unnamed protein product [Oikopleura dioica]CBY37029.1 unnamed protein product [Oikopleura dioica]
MLWRVRIGHLKSQLRYSNSILSKFAPPVPYSDEKHGRYLKRAKSELTEKDKAGKTPEEIIQLEKEMAIYIRNQEIQKVEIKRAQEDLGSMATITQGAGQKQQWFPYYQRQLLDRMEYITENQPKRPVAENKSSSIYPYKFYGEMTEWKGLDDQLNICRTNFGIKSARYFVYEHRVGKQYFERNNQVQRARMLRNQYLSGERLVSLMPAPMQPYLRLARYDKPIGYQLLFVPAFMGLVSGCQFTQLPDAYLMSIFAAGTLLTRGAGCTINDIWDHKLDAQVERCKSRPIPSGAVSVEKAKLFFAAQLSAAFGLL